MIERARYNIYRLICDECEGEPPDVGFESFAEASAWARRNGWVAVHSAEDGWRNFCPACGRALGFLRPLPPGVEETPLSRPTARWVPMHESGIADSEKARKGSRRP